MALDFIVKDVIHKINVKFMHAFLPDAKKPFNLRAVHQPELDIHGIASKADVYNITTPPKIIEDGLKAGIELIRYLVADGYRIKTRLFYLWMRIPGEYDGTETHLQADMRPEPRLRASADFREYLWERVQVQIDGKEDSEGYIAKAIDEATGTVDEVMTVGNVLTIHGYGLKIEHDSTHGGQSGVYFKPPNAIPIKAAIVVVNEPRTLKLIVPAGLAANTDYKVYVITQGSARGSGHLLKELRQSISEFTLKVAV